MAQTDQIRDQQRETWDRFSEGWSKWDDLVQQWLDPVGAQIISDLAVGSSGNHLDVAVGTGEPGLSIARLMVDGRVILTDISAGMLEAAKRRAKAQGVTNVDVRECSVDQLPFEDGSFDTISCRFGFMFFPDIQAAANELARVLRPGGRISTAVWAEPPENAWATLPMEAIKSEMDVPTPPPDSPGLFRCAQPDVIGRAFREAGLHDVVETDVRFTLDTATADEYWSFMTEVAAPVVAALANADAPTRERVRKIVLDRVHSYENDGKPQLPGHARCIKGTK